VAEWPKWPWKFRSLDFVVRNQAEQDKALDYLKKKVEELTNILTKPVRGTIQIQLQEPPMTISVHPSDTLSATVVWENAVGLSVPENAPTTWSAADMAGAAFPGAVLASGTSDQNETVTFGDPALVGAFELVAAMGVLTAKSEEIDVSPDNTPTQGVVTVAMNPPAAA